MLEERLGFGSDYMGMKRNQLLIAFTVDMSLPKSTISRNMKKEFVGVILFKLYMSWTYFM